MADGYTIKDVTRDLGFVLSLTKMFDADEDGFWRDIAMKERFKYRIDASEEPREIVIFQDPLPRGDYHFFNPFAEGFGRKSPAVQFYYKTVRIAFNLNLRTALLYMTSTLLASKEAVANKTEYALPSAVLRMSSVPVDRKTSFYDVVDEKLVEEFEELFDRMKDECIHVPYAHPTMEAKVTCPALTDEKWGEKFGKDIRKKSLNAFKIALMGVLNISKPEELASFSVKYDPDIKTAAKFYTTLSVYLKLYARFNDVLADAHGTDGVPFAGAEINLGELTAVIERLPMAYAIAKHMVQPVLPKTSAVDIKTADTSKLRIGDSAQQGSRRFAGPPVIDEFGRQGRGGGLQLGRPPESQSRFRPHVISDQPVDPFAPAVRPMSGSDIPSGGLGFGNRGGGSSYFGGSSLGGGGLGGGGLSFNAPSNFNSAEARRGYFG